MSILRNFSLSLSITWVTINVYFLPFFPWTTGITRAWFVLKGLIPYRDFTWIRNPLDIFLLVQWFKVFGLTGEAYQLLIYALFIVLTICVFILSHKLLPHKPKLAFLFYTIFVFPLFINTEIGEVLIGVLNILAFMAAYGFLKTRSIGLLFLAGFIAGLVFITKQSSITIALAIAFTLFLTNIAEKKSFRQTASVFGIYLAGVFIPFIGIIAYFAYNNALKDYLYYSIVFILGPYSRLKPYELTHGDGLWMAGAFLAVSVPFMLFWKDIKLRYQLVVLLISLTFASLFSLLPSFLSYRAFPTFPLISIVFGYNIALLMQKNSSSIKRWVVVVSCIFFVVFVWHYIGEYIVFVQENGFAPKQYIKDYGETELNIAKWIRENTDQNERIQNFTSEIIYVLSNRLPKHKYIEPHPSILRPYSKSSEVFSKDPPVVVVYDESLPEIHIGLEKWPFIEYMKRHYERISFSETLSVYKLIK